MRKILLLFSLFLMALVAWGEPIDRNEALKQANAFLSSKGIPVRQSLDMAYAQPGKAAEARSLYYVFNVGNDKGFVIVAGDDAVSPILAYADRGDFSEREMAPAAKAMLESYAQQIEMIQQDPSLSVAAATSYAAIAPMVETQWNQMEPYNYMCPTIEGEPGRSVTGCVATAMAQIMYYHKWPVAETKAIPAYQMSNGELIAGANPVTLDWDAMQSTYTGSEAEDDPAAKAVAQLMVLCGKGVQMAYSYYSSGAGDGAVVNALKSYFDYDGAIHRISRADYANADWEKAIYDELAAQRPVYLSGTSLSASGTVGHAFVCDGYDGQGLFHINWGWGGMSDGFFRLTLLNPDDHGTGGNNGSGGYSMGEAAIIGIQPNQGGTLQETAELTLETFSCTAESVERNSLFQGFSLPLNLSMWNLTSQALAVEVGIAIYDDNNQQWGMMELGLSDPALATSHGWGGTAQLTVGTRITDGTYTLRLVHKVNGSDEWTLLKNADKYYLEMRVSGNKATITNHAPNSGIAVNRTDLRGNLSVGSLQTFTYNITNSGDTYTQDIAFFVNDDILSGIGLNLDPGATDDYIFSWTPERKGTYCVGLANATTGEILYAEQYTVEEAKEYQLNFTYTVDGMEDNTVSGNSIRGTIHATNNGEEDYRDYLVCYLGYIDGRTIYLTQQTAPFAEIPAGGTVDVPFEFTGLDGSLTYAVVVGYTTEGQLFNDQQDCQFGPIILDTTAIEGIEVEEETEADQPVYNLQGVRMPDGVSLPKGIYIKGAKKIVVK